MSDGLKDKHREAIIRVMNQYPKLEKVVLFGSRAKGTFSPTSDIDLALYGDLSFADQAELAGQIEALTVPYKVDLLRVNSINNQELLKDIQQDGIEWAFFGNRESK